MLFNYLQFTNQKVLNVQLKHLQLVLGGVVSSRTLTPAIIENQQISFGIPSMELTYSTFVKKILQLICESKRLQQCLGRGYVSSQEGMPPYDRVSTKMAAHMFLLLLHFVTGGRNTPKTSAFDCYVEIFVSVVQYVLSRWNHLFPPSFSQFSFTSVSKLCKINSKTATNFPISPPAHLFLLYLQAATKTTSTSTNDQNMVEVFKRGWNPQQMLGNPPINFTILWGIGPVGCKPLFHVMPLPFVHVPKFPKSSWRP